jgi:hypothetical protein
VRNRVDGSRCRNVDYLWLLVLVGLFGNCRELICQVHAIVCLVVKLPLPHVAVLLDALELQISFRELCLAVFQIQGPVVKLFSGNTMRLRFFFKHLFQACDLQLQLAIRVRETTVLLFCDLGRSLQGIALFPTLLELDCGSDLDVL